MSRSATPSLEAVLLVLTTAMVLGLFIGVLQGTAGKTRAAPRHAAIDVYVHPGTPAVEREKIRQALVVTPNVKRVDAVSKEGLVVGDRRRSPAGPGAPGSSSQPVLFRVIPADPRRVDEIADRLAPRDARGWPDPRLPGVDSVQVSVADGSDIVVSPTGILKLMTGAFSLVMVLASIDVVAGAIGLSIARRRREVEVMGLVGATRWSMRWPFVIQGTLVGLLGGAIAVAALTLGKGPMVDLLAGRLALLHAPERIDLSLLTVAALGACIAVSAVGSGLTVRRFVRV